MLDFGYLSPDVTVTEYPGVTVIASHNAQVLYESGDDTLAPGGFVAYDGGAAAYSVGFLRG